MLQQENRDKQAGAELGQAQVKLEVKNEVRVKVSELGNKPLTMK